jgi:hypothetical protein
MFNRLGLLAFWLIVSIVFDVIHSFMAGGQRIDLSDLLLTALITSWIYEGRKK